MHNVCFFSSSHIFKTNCSQDHSFKTTHEDNFNRIEEEHAKNSGTSNNESGQLFPLGQKSLERITVAGHRKHTDHSNNPNLLYEHTLSMLKECDFHN